MPSPTPAKGMLIQLTEQPDGTVGIACNGNLQPSKVVYALEILKASIIAKFQRQNFSLPGMLKGDLSRS